MKNFLYKIYLYSFLDDFMFVYPIYVLLFKENGLSTFQISTLLAVWTFSSLVLEVPTGVLADRFSRKHLLIIAQIFRILGYTSWLLFPSYAGFMVGFVLWSINGTLKSGTFEAYVYDGMKELKIEGMYEKVLSRSKIFSFIALSIALSLGGVFANINLDLPIILSNLILVCATINIFTFKNIEQVRSTKESKYLVLLKNALMESWNNTTLLKFILLFAFTFGVYGAFDEYLALVFKDYKISLNLIGVVFASNYVAYTIGAAMAGYIKIKSFRLLVLLTFLSGILLMLPGFIDQSYQLVGLILTAAALLGFVEVKIIAGVQKSITSNSRATIISVKVFLQEFIVIFFTLAVGYFSDLFGLHAILFLTGGTMMAFALLMSVLSLTLRKRPIKSSANNY